MKLKFINTEQMKDKLQEILDKVYNLDMIASNMGYKINWDTGEVENEQITADE
jgi:hypothetical protein